MAATFRQLSRVVAVVSVIAATALAVEGTSAAAVTPPSGKVYAGVTVDGTFGEIPERSPRSRGTTPPGSTSRNTACRPSRAAPTTRW